MRLVVILLFATLLPSAVGLAQEKQLPRLPQIDWSMDHNVVLAIAAAKGNDVFIRLSVPMWAPKPGLKGDPVGPEDFNASQLRGVLNASDVQVYRKNGTLVPAKELPRLLAKESHVLWSARKIDPYYVTVLRDDVLIVVVDFQKIIQASGGSTPAPAAPAS